MDLFKPRKASSPRNPTTNQQQNGQITNTPRFSQLGGLSGASKTGPKNQYKVVPPGDGKKVI
jgi:hypothetical protein